MNYIEYLQELWQPHQELKGVGFIAVKNSFTETMTYHPITSTFNPDALQQIIEPLIEDHHIFYTPALFRSNSKSPRKDDFLYSNYDWVDIDDEECVNRFLQDPPKDASFQIKSGRGIHSLWKNAYSNLSELEEACKDRIIVYGGDKGTWNCNRLLRLPESRNHKHDGKPQVQIITSSNHRAMLAGGANAQGISAAQTLSNPPGPVVGKKSELRRLNFSFIVMHYSLPDKLIHYLGLDEEPDDRSEAYYEIGKLCRETGMNIHEAFTVLWQFEDKWKKYKGREKEELTRLLEKIYSEPKSGAKELYSIMEVINNSETVDWLIENGITVGGITVLSGPPGVGKTQFSLRAITKGILKQAPMFPWVFHRPIRTLFLSLEMGIGEVASFLRTMEFDPADQILLEDYITFHTPGESLYLNSPEGQKKLERQIKELSPELVVLDSLGSSIRGDISSDEVIRSVMDYLDTLRHRYKCAFWFIHHNRKGVVGNKEPEELEDMFGSQYIAGRATTVYLLLPNKGKPDELRLKCVKNRFGKKYGEQSLIRTSTLDFASAAERMGQLADRTRHGDDKSGSSQPQSQANGGSTRF